MMPALIPAVILAAGSGRRMGGAKALLELDGETLLQRAIRIAGTAGFSPLIAVVGSWDPGPLAVQVLHNAEAVEGMASSIRMGIAALPAEADRVLLLTVDQVSVDPALLRRLLALSTAEPARPAACAYADTVGIPAVFPRRLFPELMDLNGDRGAKAILLREKTATTPFPGGEDDLDTPGDLARIRR